MLRHLFWHITARTDALSTVLWLIRISRAELSNKRPNYPTTIVMKPPLRVKLKVVYENADKRKTSRLKLERTRRRCEIPTSKRGNALPQYVIRSRGIFDFHEFVRIFFKTTALTSAYRVPTCIYIYIYIYRRDIVTYGDKITARIRGKYWLQKCVFVRPLEYWLFSRTCTG